MGALVTLTLVDGVKVVVANSTRFITPYVLFEQQDWFEDELPFLRRLLEPGQRVVDIGANHGVYALSLAKAVAATGKVWAFEPSTQTAGLLEQSVRANGFAQVVVERSAVSDRCGTAQLSCDGHCELNALTHDEAPGAATETVAVTTLDECMQRHDWCDIDFVKIDAEGEEGRILEGALRFFGTLSPLVQYEIRAGAGTNLELAREFAALGYASYRLVPGLDLLVPFDATAAHDPYLLNLFACKPDRARRLAAKGWLVEQQQADRAPEDPAADEWQQSLAGLAYAIPWCSRWAQTVAGGDSDDVVRALALRALSHDRRRPPAARFAALVESHRLLDAARQRRPARLRDASYARVACELGCRDAAVGALQQLCNAIVQGQAIDATEPFLSPARSFDAVDPRGAFGNWLLCSAMQACERLSHFSSFYADASSLERLNLMTSLGFADAETQRRRELMRLRFGSPAPARAAA